MCKNCRIFRDRPFLALFFPALLILLWAVLVFVGCAGSKEPLKIGFAGELTGDNRAPSIKVFQGIELAVEQRNAAGGIDGRTVKLLAGDDGGNPERAEQVDRELVKKGVQAIIGHPTSTTSLAALEYINQAKVVTLSPTATADELFHREDYFFTFLASNSKLADRIARFGKKELEVSRVSIIYDLANPRYTRNYAERFKASFTGRGGSILDQQNFDSTQNTDFGAIIDRLLQRSPDALFILASSTETAAFLQQLYIREAAIPVLSCDWASTQDVIHLGGPYSTHLYLAESVHFTENTPGYGDFAAAYRRRYGEEPSLGAAKAYEAAGVILHALTQQKKGESLRAVLLKGSFRGFQQRLRFDRYGDIERSIYIKTVKDDSFELAR